MLNFISTPFTVAPPLEDYSVILDVVPIKGEITTDSFLWPVKNDFEQSKRILGNITLIEQGKKYIGLHCAFQQAAPSSIQFLENNVWQHDTELHRLKALKDCLNKLKFISPEEKIAAPLLLTKDYKSAIRKHMIDIEYFVKYVESYIPDHINLTIFYQEPKRMKSNKLKIEKIIDNVTQTI